MRMDKARGFERSVRLARCGAGAAATRAGRGVGRGVRARAEAMGEGDADADADASARLAALRARSAELLEKQKELMAKLERRRGVASSAAASASVAVSGVNAGSGAASRPAVGDVLMYDADGGRGVEATPAPAPATPTPPVQPPPPPPPPAPVAKSVVVAPPRVEEPPKCREKLNIVMVASECAPFSKTGGLGDVMQSLPKALAARGHRVMVVVPRYKEYEGVFDTGVRVNFNVLGGSTEVGYFHSYRDGVDYVFVDHGAYHHVRDSIYSGDRSAATFRNSMLCQAALEAVWQVPCGGFPYGDENLIFVANDWHASLLPVYLQAYYRDHGKFEFARSCFVIHNLAHQGRGPLNEFGALQLPAHYEDFFKLDDPFGGECMNIMQAGLKLATKVIAVSEGYAWEITTDMGGWGLAPIIREFGEGKLSGIVNGIDLMEWSPDVDHHLDGDGYTRFAPNVDSIDNGKRQCKLALQRQLGLPERDDVPILAFIGRLDDQKGVDLIAEAEGWLMSQDVQLIMLGSGREDLEGALRGMEERHRDKCRAWVGFSVEMAHRITAGADILLMPSRFEPCGLNQLYAMRYGTVPVVHAVGGLRDTVKQYDPFNDQGNGWTFDSAETHKLIDSMSFAISTFRDHRDAFKRIQSRGFDRDLGWDHAAQLYEDRFIDAKYCW